MRICTPVCVALWILCLAACAGAAEGEAFTDAAQAGPDFAVQGEYAGTLQLNGQPTAVGVQVVADGDDKFDTVLYVGGLPGAGWKRGEPREKSSATAPGAISLGKYSASIAGGKISVLGDDRQALGTLDKVERKSPTLGAAPPQGAVVLFDGTNTDEWQPGAKITDDHLLLAGAMSKREFQDFQLHVEFRTPFMPKARGQGRGNSGVYLQNRYEVQVLDSFGLEGENNECGGLYSQAAPAVNMCLPPLAWQTYDIECRGARFDAQMQKTDNTRVTIRHNGVAIYEDHQMPGITPGGADKEYPGRGPIQLQFHGNPVTYRNIWLVEQK